MQLKKYITLLAVLSAISESSIAAKTELTSSLSDQNAVAVTIYNGNLALVKDQRAIKLSNGLNDLAIKDVSGQMRPETALLRSLSAPGSISLLEQNFDFDLLTPQKMLEKSVGKTVTLIKTNAATGIETSEKATVLAANNGVVLKIGNQIETGIPGRIVFDNLPSNLRDSPTLVTKLNNNGATAQTVELSYLTSGLGWKADYVAELSPNENNLDLSGWVTLTNTSGANYNNAKLQLVAGDVNRAQTNENQLYDSNRPVMTKMAMGRPNSMAEESLLEYHLYSLDHTTTIAQNQTKQVALLSASSIPVRKELVFQGADYYYQGQYGEISTKLKAGVFVEFDNKETSHLGMPLPKGILRMYKKDKAGNAQFVGEDNINHTPKNETVRLKLGEAFDVTADKKQTGFKILPSPIEGHHLFESAFEIVLKNAKSEKVTVTMQEPIGGDWEITSENYPHAKVNSHLVTWKIDIPAEGKTTLNYKAKVLY